MEVDEEDAVEVNEVSSSLNFKNYKDVTLDDNQRESVLQTMMSQLEDSLSTTGIKAVSSVGQLQWLPNERLGLLVKKKPGADQRLGFKSDNNAYFYPEEVLAGLMFQEYFVVNQTTGLPLTLKEAYDVCLKTEEDRMIFAVYKDLKENGCKVWRRREKSETVKEGEELERSEDMSEKKPLNTSQESEEQPPAKKIRKDEQQGLLETKNLSLDMILESEQVDADFIKRLSKDWSGYKRMKTGHTSSKLPSLVVNIADHLGEDNLDERLPSSALTAKNGDNQIIRPIYYFQRIESFDQVLQSFANKGPQDMTSDDYICDDKEEPLVVLDFIRNEVKGVAIPTKDHHNLPSAAQLQKFFHEKNSREDVNLIILCIVDGFSSIKYFQYNPFNVWKEHPTLWTEVDLTRV